MNPYATRPFTVEDGIRVQDEQLYEWKRILKPDVFNQLKEWAKETNGQALTGYDVRRGDKLGEHLINSIVSLI